MEVKEERIIGWEGISGELPGDNLLYSESKWEAITLALRQNAILRKD